MVQTCFILSTPLFHSKFRFSLLCDSVILRFAQLMPTKLQKQKKKIKKKKKEEEDEEKEKEKQ